MRGGVTSAFIFFALKVGPYVIQQHWPSLQYLVPGTGTWYNMYVRTFLPNPTCYQVPVDRLLLNPYLETYKKTMKKRFSRTPQVPGTVDLVPGTWYR